MVMLLDDGCLVLCGQDTVPHASLCALVAFYQRRPLRPHGQLLTRGCGQVSWSGGPVPTRACPQAARPPPGRLSLG